MVKNLYKLLGTGIVVLAGLFMPDSVAAQELATRERQSHGLNRVSETRLNIPLRHNFSSGPGIVYARVPKAITPVQVGRASTSNMPEIYGSVVDAEAWTVSDASKIGIYKLPVSEGGKFELMMVGPNATLGGTLMDEDYYAGYLKNSYLGKVPTVTRSNIATWTSVATASADMSCMASDVSYDMLTKKVYGFFVSSSGEDYRFGTIDYRADGVSYIGSLSGNWCAIASDSDGTLYGILKTEEGGKTVSSTLYKIDKNRGTTEKVGDTGCLPYYTSSACIDPISGRLFWTVSSQDGKSGLYELDKKTGKASLVCSFPDGEQVCGLFVIAPAAADEAPAAPVNVKATFPEGALKGNVTFDVPNTLFDGTKAEGMLEYTLAMGSTIIASGKVEYGQSVSIPVTVEKAGNYAFTVTLMNEGGNSPSETVTLFIGHGTPTVPVVTASFDDGKFHVEWTPVTESSNGGYLDPEAVTYKVIRYPSKVTVAQATKETSVDVEMEEPTTLTKYWYGVQATYNGITSEEGISNILTLGSIVPPYTHTFDSADKADNHVVINANNDYDYNDDPRTWYYRDEFKSVVIYCSSGGNDDWLFTPQVRLEAGKAYTFTVMANAYSKIEYATEASYPEKLEVKFGLSPTVAGMTGNVIDAFELNNLQPKDYSGLIIPEKTGSYYIGFHAISTNGYYLMISGYSFGTPMAASVPGPPTDMELIPDPNGAFSIKTSVKAPVVDIMGEQLESLDRLELWRGITLVKSFSPVKPGAVCTFTDDLSEGGDTEYHAIAYNNYGGGEAIRRTVFVGINKPAAPSVVHIVETDNYGEVTLSWPKVDTDFAGYPLNPDLISYTVWQLQGETQVVIADDIEGDSYTLQAVNAGEQKFVHYYVSAQTEGGISTHTDSELIPCGNPYPVPYNETFPAGNTVYTMAYTDNSTATWTFGTDSSEYGVTSHTGDNGYLVCCGQKEGDSSIIHTLKVHIGDILQPGLMVYTYNYTEDGPDDNIVELLVYDNGKWEVLKSCVISSLGEESGWYLVAASLEAYKGKDVLVGVQAICHNYKEIFIDDLSVATMVANDLAITSIQAPESVGFNTPFVITAEVTNKGVNAVENFSIRLLEGDEIAGTISVDRLLAGATEPFSFEYQYDPLTSEGSTFTVEIVNPEDENPTDNRSESVTVKVSIPTLPVVNHFWGAASPQGGIYMCWNEPSLHKYRGAPVTETFEEYESFLNCDIGEWENIDEDGGAIGKINDANLPGIEYGSKQAWWVMDAEYEELNKSYAAFSGTKYIAQMYAMDPETKTAITCADWFISPLLTGDAQTISFYAKSYSSTYPETFEVLYSTTDTDLDSFKSAGARAGIPARWESYSFKLPEGALYFAIVCRSTNKFMMLVDDITYTPQSSTALEIKGYNLWRDGVKINSEPIDGLEYTDKEGDMEKHHEYRLTVVYDKGESAPSVEPNFDPAGIAGVDADAVHVAGGAGCIAVEAPAGACVAVFNAAGMQCGALIATGKDTLQLGAGVYVVTVDDRIFKVVVK